MKKGKLIKQEAKTLFLSDQAKKKARREELSKMTAEKRVAEKKKDKLLRKASKKERKEELLKMDKPEKKSAKKLDKYYKKYKRRPRKYAALALVVLALGFVVSKAVPLISDFSEILAIELVSDTPEAKAALANGDRIAEAISDEGIVLMRNNESLLPLLNKQVNVFGYSAFNFRLSGGGSGGSDQSRSVNFFDGLTNAGIEYNTALYDFYMQDEAYIKQNQSTGLMQIVDFLLGKGILGEPAIDYLTNDVIENAQAYSDTAIIVLNSSSVEASDAELEELKISDNKKALIERVASNFENVIVIVNAGNTLELGILDDYPSIKSILWTGTPGSKGTLSLGKILAGEVNPSGRLTDTYVYDLNSHPSVENFGDYDYTNIKGMGKLEYEEGIYVGYRYYETKYMDEATYQSVVQFPFGHGLSYTSFEWELMNSSADLDRITMEIKVTNTGDIAGKDVVQLYFSAPYYEGGIEKSAIELAAFDKTDLLAPGETEILNISFATRDMSSYDMMNEGAYVLDPGTYEIYASKNVHESVLSMTYDLEEKVVYNTDETTGTPIENRFSYADGGLTYLSRNDWSGTYPNADDISLTASDALLDLYHSVPEKVAGILPSQGEDNQMMLSDLRGLDYDDPNWEAFLNQLTFDEMNEYFNSGAYRTIAIERLGIPATILLDGPAGINNFFKETTAAAYPTEIVIASTWNEELAYKMGEAVGIEANAYGLDGWYAPGMNIHRSPKGGRNFEYFSEDPLLSGKMSAGMISGAQSKDILVFMKHFALNEQEINARSGVLVWANEQAIRELYLRPFEISVKEADVSAAMSSFVLIGHKWAGGNPELLQDVLRNEWGFNGLVSTDAVLGDFMDVNLALRYGNELMLAPSKSGNIKKVEALYEEDPVGVLNGLRDRLHTTLYTLLNRTNVVD